MLNVVANGVGVFKTDSCLTAKIDARRQTNQMRTSVPVVSQLEAAYSEVVSISLHWVGFAHLLLKLAAFHSGNLRCVKCKRL